MGIDGIIRIEASKSSESTAHAKSMAPKYISLAGNSGQHHKSIEIVLGAQKITEDHHTTGVETNAAKTFTAAFRHCVLSIIYYIMLHYIIYHTYAI